MLIYIEGLDKAGKSTFAKQLTAAAQISIYRKLPPEKLDLTEHHSYFKGVGFALTELHNLFGFSAIVDRSFISDWIYTNRDKEVRPIEIWREWETRHHDLLCAIIVYVDAPSEIIESRVSAVPDPYMKVSDITRFRDLYEIYLRQTLFRVVRINGIADEAERSRELEALKEITYSHLR